MPCQVRSGTIHWEEQERTVLCAHIFGLPLNFNSSWLPCMEVCPLFAYMAHGLGDTLAMDVPTPVSW